MFILVEQLAHQHLIDFFMILDPVKLALDSIRIGEHVRSEAGEKVFRVAPRKIHSNAGDAMLTFFDREVWFCHSRPRSVAASFLFPVTMLASTALNLRRCNW